MRAEHGIVWGGVEGAGPLDGLQVKGDPDEKIRIVLESLNTNVSTVESCRKHGVSGQLVLP